jgi:hypothetical protein
MIVNAPAPWFYHSLDGSDTSAGKEYHSLGEWLLFDYGWPKRRSLNAGQAPLTNCILGLSDGLPDFDRTI